MECISECSSTKLQILNPQYSIDSICRLPQYYVDPLSTEIIELGTIKYPYKSMRAVTSEILNIYSNLNINITVYLKENEDVYISDLTSYFINITSIKVMSYSDTKNALNPNKANLIPTQITLPTVSKRTSFHILKNMDLNLSQILAKGTFSVTQQGMIKSLKSTFLVSATNFYIENINIFREYVDYNKIITFTQLIGLQKYWLDVRNTNFNISGTAFVSYDPVNINFQSLYIDTYALRGFANLLIPCNYPEASLSGIIYANNIKVVTSSQRTFSEDPSIISYMGPANISVSNFDLSDYSVRSPNVGAGLLAISSSNCIPNDGLTQIIQVDNFTFSVFDNSLGIKSNSLIIMQDQNMYRKIVINATDLKFYSLEIPSQIFMYVIGNIQSQLLLSNSIFKDSSTVQYVLGSAAHQKVALSNITFSNFTNVKNSVFVTYKCFAVIVNSMNFINFQMDKTNI